MTKKNITIVTFLILFITALFTFRVYLVLQKYNNSNITRMNLNSSTFVNGGIIPSKYTCDGDNINPPLTISKVPQTAKSLVLIMDDPDAPFGPWLHWSLWNIPVTTLEIKENSIPFGSIEGNNDFNITSYRGPCPPNGTHSYMFKLYALDTVLNLIQGANLYDLKSAIKNHILDQAILTGNYLK